MTETWLPGLIRRDGPAWKQGYVDVPSRSLTLIEGEVWHSAEGYRSGIWAMLNGPQTSSWTGTVYKVGPPEQHYPLEAVTWHAGVKGDRRFDTSLVGNLTLVGWEVEGIAGEPWTANQVYWSNRISIATRELCPQFRANPPTLRLNEWEHHWLSNTLCPSGRNPWGVKFAAINAAEEEDDNMTNEELATRLGQILRDNTLNVKLALHRDGGITDAIEAHAATPHSSGGVTFADVKDEIDNARVKAAR